MSTITRELAKLFRKITNSEIDAEGNAHVVLSPADSLLINNARIALASLELEHGMIRRFDLDMSNCDSFGQDCGADMVEDLDGEYVLWHEVLPYLYRYDEYTATTATVYVPDAATAIRACIDEFPESVRDIVEECASIAENAYRAAMLQAEPVSNSDELPLDYLQGHKDGLEWAAQLAEANHPQTGDWLYDDQIELARAIRKGPDMPTVQGGNSPVIPDGWVMVPVELTPDMRAAWDSAPYTDDDDNDMQAAYRAMIAAAPQWKVK
ncbi:hypothetical protein U9377_13255 [Escherichia coli]